MAFEFECQLELGTHAIGAGYQHGLFVFLGDFHHGAKPAQAAKDFRTHGPFGKGFDVLDQLIARVDINAGIAVGKAGSSHGFLVLVCRMR